MNSKISINKTRNTKGHRPVILAFCFQELFAWAYGSNSLATLGIGFSLGNARSINWGIILHNNQDKMLFIYELLRVPRPLGTKHNTI